MTENAQPILLFDGVCNLCSGSVRFVLQHNRKGNIRFASLQSEQGKELLKQGGLRPDRLESLVFIEHGKLFTKSDAALQLSAHLDRPWNYASILGFIPRPLRDMVYGLIAKNRYRWFGKKETCWIPKPEWKNRFLDTA